MPLINLEIDYDYDKIILYWIIGAIALFYILEIKIAIT